MYSYSVLLLLAATSVRAWFPHDRNMTTVHGNNLFDMPQIVSRASDSSASPDWLPGKMPIRGVNLGSQFVLEPWMAQNQWPNVLKCSDDQKSEFDCVQHLGQGTANTNFKNHWASWITQNDILTMSEYGLNTIRIPVGYWMDESLKYPSEFFPEGGIDYLNKICGWASDEGMYIIIDLHGAPFAQVGQNADTGQYAAAPTDQNPDFYQDSQYDRALSFLEYMTNYIHNNGNANGGSGPMRNVGMIELVNEPLTEQNDLTQSMRQSFYPNAFSKIRAAENAIGISNNNKLHIQMMNSRWGAGEPDQYLTDNTFAAYDYHRYLEFDNSVTQTQQGYLDGSCGADVTGDYPLIVGEWSLAIGGGNQFNGPFWPISNNLNFYKQYFAAQAGIYEKQSLGWIFWSWKTEETNDPRSNYQAAVQAGIIPKNLNDVHTNSPC